MAPIRGAKTSGFRGAPVPPITKNTGINPNPTFYFLMRKFTTRGVCECQDGPWGVPTTTTAGPADKHDPPPRGATLWCQGSTTDGATRFFILNVALKDPGTRALALMHPWKEHSFLRRRSYLVHTKFLWLFHSQDQRRPPPLILLALLQGRGTVAERDGQLRANALYKSYHAGPWANRNRIKHLPHSFFDSGFFLIAVPRGCLWPQQVSSRWCSVILVAEKWVNGPLGTWNRNLLKSSLNTVHQKCTENVLSAPPGHEKQSKVGISPKHVLKSTANGAKVPKTTPMKETLIPCTQGLANTGVPFGLDLPHGP
jgi:hypothetical protein